MVKSDIRAAPRLLGDPRARSGSESDACGCSYLRSENLRAEYTGLFRASARLSRGEIHARNI